MLEGLFEHEQMGKKKSVFCLKINYRAVTASLCMRMVHRLTTRLSIVIAGWFSASELAAGTTNFS